jgi:N-acetyltransferase
VGKIMRLEVPSLIGNWIRLDPLIESHRESLRLAAENEKIWQVTLTRAMGPEFDSWFDTALAQRDSGDRVPFIVQRLLDGKVIGSTSYLDIDLYHHRIEIGGTWYCPETWGTVVNPECKFLLLQYAFEVLRVNRVALITDILNLRSQAAIAKLGAIREGVLRSHMISQGGRVRDTVVFSIIAEEWPKIQTGLIARITRKE